MIPLRSITSRTITAPASLVRRSTRDSITTPALKLGWKVDGVSPMGGSALADITAQMPESQTHLAQEPAQSAVSMNREGSLSRCWRPGLEMAVARLSRRAWLDCVLAVFGHRRTMVLLPALLLGACQEWRP